MNDLKRTALYDMHLKHKGKMVDFAGYALPIQYENISLEHHHVRQAVGVFDVSHMGEVMVRGKDARAFVHKLVTNNVLSLGVGQVLYTVMCNPQGGVVDDLLVYCRSDEAMLLVINAANIDKDVQWIQDQARGWDLVCEDMSEAYSQLAVQGPLAQEVLQALTSIDLKALKFFSFEENVRLAGIEVILSRTGYTGEDGFEIYVKPDQAVDLWEALFSSDDRVKAIGLGARDTLRFEACLPLYGHEINQEISPLEAGLKMFVNLESGDFIGRQALVNSLDKGLERKLIGIELDKGIARQGSLVYVQDQEVGFVTTGYKSPTLDKSIALALVNVSVGKIGSSVCVKVRKKDLHGHVVSRRFYKKNYIK